MEGRRSEPHDDAGADPTAPSASHPAHARGSAGGRSRSALGQHAPARDGAIHGWKSETGLDLVALAAQFGEITGVGALIVTGIDVDGTLAGPDVEQLGAVLAAVETPLIASGGVGSLTDLQALAS